MFKKDGLDDIRCIQHGACKTTYSTRHEVVHELRLCALQENNTSKIEFGGVQNSTERTSGFGSNVLT